MACIGFGAKISQNFTASYVDVVESAMIQIPQWEAGSVETTHLNSTANTRTFIPGLLTMNTVSFESNFAAASFTTLSGIFGKDKQTGGTTALSWKITAPDEDGAGALVAQTYTFPGFLSKLTTSFEPDNVVKIKGEITVAGAVTVA